MSPGKVFCFMRFTGLSAFVTFQKATINFVMSVCPYVRLSVSLPVRMEQLISHCTDFRIILFLSIFVQSDKKIQV